MPPCYRKIAPRIWLELRGTTETEKLIALYCLSGDQTRRTGLFLFSPARAAEDLETLPQTFAKGFKNVIERFGWKYDPDARVLWIPRWWKYNTPANPNVLTSCMSDLDLIPPTPLISLWAENLTDIPKSQQQTFRQRIAERYPKGLPQHYPKDTPERMPDKELELEQELEQQGKKRKGVQGKTNADPEPTPSPVDASVDPSPHDLSIRENPSPSVVPAVSNTPKSKTLSAAYYQALRDSGKLPAPDPSDHPVDPVHPCSSAPVVKPLPTAAKRRSKSSPADPVIASHVASLTDLYRSAILSYHPDYTDDSLISGRAARNIAHHLNRGIPDTDLALAIRNYATSRAAERTMPFPFKCSNFFGQRADNKNFRAYLPPDWRPPRAFPGAASTLPSGPSIAGDGLLDSLDESDPVNPC